jgi:hypothetical protein
MTGVLTSEDPTAAAESRPSRRIAELLDQQEQREQTRRSYQRDQGDDERPFEKAESQHRG